MKTRAITAFFFGIAMLASLLLGETVFLIFYLFLSMATLFEYFRLVGSEQYAPQLPSGIALGTLLFRIFSSIAQGSLEYKLLALCIPVVILIYIIELYRKTEKPFQNIALTILGPVYVVVPFGLYLCLAFLDGSFNFQYPLGLLLLIWANDTGAYVLGVKFGKNRLFERHSPKKSWEGFFGGLFITLIAAGILSQYFTALNLNNWLIVGLIASVAGTFGDLTESMLKRSLNTKDSGGLLPGHGGLLDRFDSLFFAAPLFYFYLLLF
jgi:phosphatidate cytidylyltransferase